MNFNNIMFESAFGKSDQLKLKEANFPEVVFSGRSNVGKSSLINKLVNRKAMARVSSKPGKTGTINFYNLDNKIRLVDLPGYGYAKVSSGEKKRWAELVEGYFNGNRDVRLVIQIVDIRHKPTADDLNMINFLNERGFNFIVVLTKSDKLNKTERITSLNNIDKEFLNRDVQILTFSSVTGEGVEELRNIISNMLE